MQLVAYKGVAIRYARRHDCWHAIVHLGRGAEHITVPAVEGRIMLIETVRDVIDSRLAEADARLAMQIRFNQAFTPMRKL